MTTTTRNDAPERLYTLLAEFIRDERAAERRATVERIRAAIADVPFPVSDGAIYGKAVEQYAQRVRAILDEEAAR